MRWRVAHLRPAARRSQLGTQNARVTCETRVCCSLPSTSAPLLSTPAATGHLAERCSTVHNPPLAQLSEDCAPYLPFADSPAVLTLNRALRDSHCRCEVAYDCQKSPAASTATTRPCSGAVRDTHFDPGPHAHTMSDLKAAFRAAQEARGTGKPVRRWQGGPEHA